MLRGSTLLMRFGANRGVPRIDSMAALFGSLGMASIQRRHPKLIAGMLSLAGLLAPAHSFDLSPQGTQFDRDAVKGMSARKLDALLTSIASFLLPKFKEAVHEELTHRSFGCTLEGPVLCGNPDGSFATPYILAGVRWNDDPPFQLNASQEQVYTRCRVRYDNGKPMTIRFISQPGCWAEIFMGAKSAIAGDPDVKFDPSTQAALPLRSHFGDLQYLHSMAVQKGELPADTQTRIMGWAQFTWGVVIGNYGLGTWLKDVDVPLVREAFSSNGWRVQDLFALGDPSLREHVDEVAFGSLLHVVQDSFSLAHVERIEPVWDAKCPGTNELAPGPIREFHTYKGQDPDIHAEADTRASYVTGQSVPGAVEVGRVLRRMKKDKTPWADVQVYLQCVFQLTPDAMGATKGRF